MSCALKRKLFLFFFSFFLSLSLLSLSLSTYNITVLCRLKVRNANRKVVDRAGLRRVSFEIEDGAYEDAIDTPKIPLPSCVTLGDRVELTSRVSLCTRVCSRLIVPFDVEVDNVLCTTNVRGDAAVAAIVPTLRVVALFVLQIDPGGVCQFC